MTAIELDQGERETLCAALQTEIETQLLAKDRVDHMGHAWRGRDAIVTECRNLVAKIATTSESEAK